MADDFTTLPSDAGNLGDKVDTETLSVSGQTVVRQRIRLGGLGATELADVKAARPAVAAEGLVTREAPRVDGWSVTHSPAVNTQASASKAAGGAGVRHVCTGVSARLVAGTAAPAAVQGTLNLRDGATGAGTILASWTVVLAASIGARDEINLTGLEIPGTANTAMTLEFAAASGANTFESVNLFGYDAS